MKVEERGEREKKKRRQARRAVCIIDLVQARSFLIFAPSLAHQQFTFRLDSGAISGETHARPAALFHGITSPRTQHCQPADDKSDSSSSDDIQAAFLDELELSQQSCPDVGLLEVSKRNPSLSQPDMLTVPDIRAHFSDGKMRLACNQPAHHSMNCSTTGVVFTANLPRQRSN